MKDDLISRSALTDAIVDLLVFEWGYEGIEASVKQIFSEIPAVDAETVFEQMGLVKEAFDMAKSSLVPVVRCRDCKWLYNGLDMYCCTKHTGLALITPDGSGFCSYGERRTDDEDLRAQ